MKKPHQCQGCPLYADGIGFVEDVVGRGRLTVSFDFPDEAEERRGRAGIGARWDRVKASLLPLTQVEPSDTNITHVIRCRYRKQTKTGKWYSTPVFEGIHNRKDVKDAVEHCKVHDVPDPFVDLTMALGPLNHYKYGPRNDSQFNWRGHLTPTNDTYFDYLFKGLEDEKSNP